MNVGTSGTEQPPLPDRGTTLDTVEPSYSREDGTIELDLTALPNSGAVHTKVHIGHGDVRITVPTEAEVDVLCTASLGTTSRLNQMGPKLHVTEDGADGPGRLHVSLGVSSGSGLGDVHGVG